MCRCLYFPKKSASICGICGQISSSPSSILKRLGFSFYGKGSHKKRWRKTWKRFARLSGRKRTHLPMQAMFWFEHHPGSLSCRSCFLQGGDGFAFFAWSCAALYAAKTVSLLQRWTFFTTELFSQSCQGYLCFQITGFPSYWPLSIASGHFLRNILPISKNAR